MLAALLTLLVIGAVAYALAIAPVGGVIALVFVAAFLVLAYRRLVLLAYSLAFTVLLAAYPAAGPGLRPWYVVLGVLLALLWSLNLRPLRTPVAGRQIMRPYPRLVPAL